MPFMRHRWSRILPALVLVCAPAWAEQDFYGVQMRDENWAKKLVLSVDAPTDANDLREGPVLDQAVRAEASLLQTADERLDFRVTVFNDSSSPISADYRFREFYIVARDGKRYPLIDSEETMVPETILPRTQATFSPSLGNLPMRNSDVEMIACSFDLGRTQIFLFPWSRKETVSKLVSPPPPPEDVKEERKKAPKKQEIKKEKLEAPKAKTPAKTEAPKAEKPAAKQAEAEEEEVVEASHPGPRRDAGRLAQAEQGRQEILEEEAGPAHGRRTEEEFQRRARQGRAGSRRSAAPEAARRGHQEFRVRAGQRHPRRGERGDRSAVFRGSRGGAA
jgi:hypothetical protein